MRKNGWLKNLAAVGFGLGVACGLVGLAELTCYVLIKTDHYRSNKKDYSIQFSDEVFTRKVEGKYSLPISLPAKGPPPAKVVRHGYRPDLLDVSKKFPPRYFDPSYNVYRIRPNQVAKASVRLKTGELVYDATYTIDEHGHRVTPGQSGRRDKYLVYFGCSYVVGEGQNDDQTLPYFTAQRAKHYRVYNFGVDGWGPSHVLGALRESNFSDVVTEKSGIGIYNFINAHGSRVIGPISYLWGSHTAPYFEEDADGNLVQNGDLNSARPFLTALYRVLANSQIFKFFNIDLPPKATPEHLLKIGKIMLAVQNEFYRQFPNSKFIVVIYPGEMFGKGLIPFFEEHGIYYLNYAEVNPADYTAGHDRIDYDGHPTSEAYQFLASQIVTDLHLDKP